MTNLIEAMARAMQPWPDEPAIPGWMETAKRVLAAIEAAGYRVVPVEPTETMIRRAGVFLDRDPRPAIADGVYRQMLAAAPKVTNGD